MNHLYVIFYFINIFAAYVNSASLGSAADMYDVVTKNFSYSCPALSNNILVNSTSKYLSDCKELSFINPPTEITTINTNKFYCIGILVANMQLCNTISTYEYEKLPKTSQELETKIKKIQEFKPFQLCNGLKNLNILNDEKIIPGFANTVIVLKKELIGDHCAKFCSEYRNENATNVLCSMMYYIHDHIKNISQITSLEKVMIPTSRNSVKPDVKKIIKPVVTSEKIPNEELDKNSVHIQSVSESNTNENKVHVQPVDVPQILPHVEPKVNHISTISNKTSSTPESNNAKEIIEVLPNALENHPPVAEEPAVKEVSPTVKGENQSTQIKNNGDDTNKTQKEIKPLVEKTTESLALVDDKVEITTTSTTEFNFLTQHSDAIEYDDDADIDDTGKLNDDPNPIPDNIQSGYSNGRTEFNLNKQTVDVEEESNFFSYFMFFSVMFIAGYVVYHNKQKIMALILEGRRDRNSRRRPSTSSYRKLNSNLEEAVTSKCSGSASHVIY